MRDPTDRPAALTSAADGSAAPWPPRLPRAVESGKHRDAVEAALDADRRLLWSGGTLRASHVPLSSSLRTALAALGSRGMLVRGLESAEAELAAERRGLDALPADLRARQGRRVSRVLVVSDDGAAWFYRHVERLVMGNTPRVLVCRVACGAAELGALAFGAGSDAKLVLTNRKSAAAAVLESLIGS